MTDIEQYLLDTRITEEFVEEVKSEGLIWEGDISNEFFQEVSYRLQEMAISIKQAYFFISHSQYKVLETVLEEAVNGLNTRFNITAIPVGSSDMIIDFYGIKYRVIKNPKNDISMVIPLMEHEPEKCIVIL